LEELGYLQSGTSYVPIPAYLIREVEAKVGSPEAISGYLVKLLNLALQEGGTEVPAVEERASVEARLRALGYLD
jgi:hypothetical protein